MKIFTFAQGSTCDAANVSVDSAARLRNEPFFVPDDQPWCADIYLGVKITRLGMNIATRFAPRYYGPLTVVAHPRAPRTDYEWSRDAAVVVNGELDIKACPAECTLTVSGSDGSDSPFEARTRIGLEPLLADINSRISDISRWHTLKTGDIVALKTTIEPLPMPIGADYRISLDGNEMLHLKAR